MQEREDSWAFGDFVRGPPARWGAGRFDHETVVGHGRGAPVDEPPRTHAHGGASVVNGSFTFWRPLPHFPTESALDRKCSVWVESAVVARRRLHRQRGERRRDAA